MNTPNEPKTKDKRTTTIACSAALTDGTLVEMILSPDGGRTSFAVWKDGTLSRPLFFDLPDGSRLAPYSARNNLLSHKVLLLASNPQEFQNSEELLFEVRRFIHRYCDISDGFEEIAAHYVLFSWIHDVFNEVPYLRVRGDFGTGKSRFLLTVGSICYKPIFASGASTVSPLFRILDAFRGTLVMDESDFRLSDERAEIVKILNNGNARGFPVLRSEATPTKEYNPRAFHVFGPKIIASRGLFADRALESRCITEALGGHSLRPEIPLNLPPEFDAESQQLRNKLLMFRFLTRDKPRELQPERGRAVEPRIAQIFAPLIATIENELTKEHLLALVRQYSGQLVAERGMSIEAQLLEIIHELRGTGRVIAVKDVAAKFGERFGTEYNHPVTPRWIGSLMRSRLNLTPMKSHGNFVMSPSDEGKLERLFERFGVMDDGDVVGERGADGIPNVTPYPN